MTLFHPWEVELGEMVTLITDQVGRTAPTRAVFDSVSEMRLLAEEPRNRPARADLRSGFGLGCKHRCK
jgi:hypothetical protein